LTRNIQTKELQKEIKLGFYVMWCYNTLDFFLLRSLFIIIFFPLWNLHANFCLIHHSCNYQLFISLSHIILIYLLSISIVRDIAKYLKDICSKSSKNYKELSLYKI